MIEVYEKRSQYGTIFSIFELLIWRGSLKEAYEFFEEPQIEIKYCPPEENALGVKMLFVKTHPSDTYHRLVPGSVVKKGCGGRYYFHIKGRRPSIINRGFTKAQGKGDGPNRLIKVKK